MCDGCEQSLDDMEDQSTIREVYSAAYDATLVVCSDRCEAHVTNA